MKQHFISLVLFFSFLLSGCMPLKQTEVTSPNGHIRLAFALDGNNRMTYQVSVGDTVFIAPSLLGFTAKDGVNLAEGFKVINTDFTTYDETWTRLGEKTKPSATITTKWLSTCPIRQIPN